MITRMHKAVVYIAGPFRAQDQWQQEQNIRRAEQLAWECWRTGLVPICPHLNTRYFQGSLPDNVWLEGDLEILRRCDMVLVVRGWMNSEGTKAEIAFAEQNHIPVFFELSDLYQHIISCEQSS